MIYTYHALRQYASRTGRDMTEALTPLSRDIKTGKHVSHYEALDRGFNIIKRFKGDEYIIWYDGSIKEDLCGIVAKDGALKTVLTKNLYSWCNRPMKIRNEAKARYEEGFSDDV